MLEKIYQVGEVISLPMSAHRTQITDDDGDVARKLFEIYANKNVLAVDFLSCYDLTSD